MDLDWFGRWFSPDERDRNFPMAALLPDEVELPRYQYWYNAGILDQRSTPRCVGFSGKGLLMDGPVRNMSYISPDALYSGAQDNDEWPGNDYPGTSVRGLMRFLMQLGYITEYRWAQNIDDIRNHLALRGPVLLGTVWTPSMNHPDSNGFLWPTDEESDMGHAYELRGGNFERGDLRMKQTWGYGWGHRGLAWMKEEVVDHLVFERSGEAACVVERKIW